MTISLAQASVVVHASLEEARRLGMAPLTVAVLDPGGHLVAFVREDGSGILRPQIAIGKAWAALGMGFPTRVLEQRAEAMPGFFASLNAASEGRFIALPGGVLIRDLTGRLLGAVGASGDVSHNDELAVVAGVQAAGLVADIGLDPS